MTADGPTARAVGGTSHLIAVIPGDGIGLEVTEAAVSALRHVCSQTGVELTMKTYPWGSRFYLQTGEFIPEDGLDELNRAEAILFGAHGDPAVRDVLAAWGMILRLRQTYDQYVNLRPVRLLPGVESPLRVVEGDIDFAIVRENLEGELAGHGGVTGAAGPGGVATELTIVTRYGTERIADYAFELARRRRGLLTYVTKSNAIRHALGYWDDVILEVAQRYPDVTVDRLYVDAAAAELVRRPHTFDVLLCTSLHGDILSDLGAALVGGLGAVPSANLDPSRTHPSLFEPIHGSAPDIAGKGIANPTAAILSAAMLLDHIGETHAGELLRDAVCAVLADGEVRTRDFGGASTTRDFTDAVCAAVGRLGSAASATIAG